MLWKSWGVALAMLLGLELVAAAEPTVVLLDVVQPPEFLPLSINDQHLLVANKALTGTYANQSACGDIKFYVGAHRRDLWDLPGVRWMVIDMRTEPSCAVIPPDAPWANASSLAGLGLIRADSLACQPIPADVVFSLDPMAVVGAAQITSFMQAMFWSDVVLLSNKSCSMDAMQPDSRVALLSATTAAGINITANQNKSQSCVDLAVAKHQVFLLVSASATEAATVIIMAHKQGWLAPGNVLLFNTAVSSCDVVIIKQLIADTFKEPTAAARFEQVVRHVGFFPGIAVVAERIQMAFETYGITDETPPVPASWSNAAVWQVSNLLRLRIMHPTCNVSFTAEPVDVLHVGSTTNLIIPTSNKLRALRAKQLSAGEPWLFLDEGGNPTSTPFLLLEPGPTYVPRATIPITLHIALVSDVPASPQLVSTLNSFITESGVVGVRHPNVQVDCVTFTAGRTCQHAVNAITNGTLQFHAAVALVGPDCRRLLETASAAINLPVVFVASGEARPSMPPPTAYTIFQPHYVIPDAIGRLLRHLELQHPILVVRQPWSAEQLDFLRGTGPRPQIVIPPDDASTVSSLTTHDPLLTSAAAPSFGPYLDVINEIISAASPLVVIDIEPWRLPGFLAALAHAQLNESPFFYVLTTWAAFALPDVDPVVLASFANRLVSTGYDRATPSDDVYTTALASPALQGTFPFATFTGMVEAVHVLLGAAARELNAHGMGKNVPLTRTHMLAALAGLNSDQPLPGLLNAFWAFHGQIVTTAPRVSALQPSGASMAFAAVISSGNVAVYRLEVLHDVHLPTAADYDSASADTDEANAWWIALIVVGIVAVVLLLAVVLWRRRSRKAALSAGPLTEQQLAQALSVHEHKLRVMRRIEPQDVEIGEAIGHGSFGQIYRGEVKLRYGSRTERDVMQYSRHSGTHIDAAPIPQAALSSADLYTRSADPSELSPNAEVPLLPSAASQVVTTVPVCIKAWQSLAELTEQSPAWIEQTVAQLVQECQVLAQFYDVEHFVNLQGLLMREDKFLGAVYDYCAGGNLAEHLATHMVPLWTKLSMACDVAMGMEVLEKYGATHLDLSARHVLVTAERRCKLMHIGLPSMRKAYYELRLRTPNVRYCAPEVLRSLEFSIKSDVWAYGVVLYELATNAKTPFDSEPSVEVKRLVLEGETLRMPIGWPHIAKSCAKACFQWSPAKRPAFAAIRDTMEKARDAEPRPQSRAGVPAQAQAPHMATWRGENKSECELGSLASTIVDMSDRTQLRQPRKRSGMPIPPPVSSVPPLGHDNTQSAEHPLHHAEAMEHPLAHENAQNTKHAAYSSPRNSVDAAAVAMALRREISRHERILQAEQASTGMLAPVPESASPTSPAPVSLGSVNGFTPVPPSPTNGDEHKTPRVRRLSANGMDSSFYV